MGQHAPPTLDRGRGGEGAERQRNPHHIHNGFSNRGIGEASGAPGSQEAPPPAALSSVGGSSACRPIGVLKRVYSKEFAIINIFLIGS